MVNSGGMGDSWAGHVSSGLCSPHLLIVDIGQDACNDLQQEDDEEQDEVLVGRNRVRGAPSNGC